MHAAFQAYVEQVLMPTLIPDDSVILDNPAYRRLVTIVSGISDVSFGSRAASGAEGIAEETGAIPDIPARTAEARGRADVATVPAERQVLAVPISRAFLITGLSHHSSLVFAVG